MQFWSDIEKPIFDISGSYLQCCGLAGKFLSCLVLLVKKLITVKAKAPNNVVLTAGGWCFLSLAFELLIGVLAYYISI